MFSGSYNNKIALSSDPVWSGYTFLGWQEKSTGLVYAAEAAYQVVGNATFTARWEKNDDKVIVKFFDGDGHMVDWQSVSSGDYVAAPGAPTKDGFRFDGWQLETQNNGSTPSVAAGGNVRIMGDAGDEVVYIAQWLGETYTLHIQGLNATGELKVGTTTYPIPQLRCCTDRCRYRGDPDCGCSGRLHDL